MMTRRLSTDPIGAAEVETELARVLASEPFAAAPALAAFLAFVVRETLAGRGERLKAYTIAVGALDRPADFDPNDNPLVRVQARRLRAALDRYHRTEGRTAAVRIELPIGTYVPTFTRDPDAPADPSPAPLPPEPLPTEPAGPPGSYRRHLLAAAVLVAIGLAALVGVLSHQPSLTPPPVSSSTPAPAASPEATVPIGPPPLGEGKDVGRVLPLFVVEIEVRPQEGFDFDGELYRRRLEGFAERFDDLVVVSRRSPDYRPPDGQPIYAFRLVILRDGNSTNGFYQLIHAADRRVLRSGALRIREPRPGPPPDDPVRPPPLDDDLDLVRDLVRANGSIDHDLSRLTDLAPELACLATARRHLDDQDPAFRAESRACLEAVVAANPRLVPAMTGLAVDRLAEGLPAERGADTPLGPSRRLLDRALRLAPASAAPLAALQTLRLLEGDVPAAGLAGRRALEANPWDLTAVAAHGALLARAGSPETALRLLDRVTRELAMPPPEVAFSTFLALEALDRTAEADARAAALLGSRRPLHLLAFGLAAHRHGDPGEAATAVAELRRIAPDAAADPLALLTRNGIAAPLARRFADDLRLVGLPAPRR